MLHVVIIKSSVFEELPGSRIYDSIYFHYTACHFPSGRKVGLAERSVHKSNSVEAPLRSSLWRPSIAFRNTEILREAGLIKLRGIRDINNCQVLHGNLGCNYM